MNITMNEKNIYVDSEDLYLELELGWIVIMDARSDEGGGVLDALPVCAESQDLLWGDLMGMVGMWYGYRHRDVPSVSSAIMDAIYTVSYQWQDMTAERIEEEELQYKEVV